MLLKSSGEMAVSTLICTGPGRLLDADLVVTADNVGLVKYFDSVDTSEATASLNLMTLSVPAVAGSADHGTSLKGIGFSQGLVMVTGSSNTLSVARYEQVKLS